MGPRHTRSQELLKRANSWVICWWHAENAISIAVRGTGAHVILLKVKLGHVKAVQPYSLGRIGVNVSLNLRCPDKTRSILNASMIGTVRCNQRCQEIRLRMHRRSKSGLSGVTSAVSGYWALHTAKVKVGTIRCNQLCVRELVLACSQGQSQDNHV
jgi:hypothetical protein